MLRKHCWIIHQIGLIVHFFNRLMEDLLLLFVGDVSVIEDNSQLAIKFPSILPGPEAILVLEYKVEYSSDMLNNFGPLYINKNDGNEHDSLVFIFNEFSVLKHK